MPSALVALDQRGGGYHNRTPPLRVDIRQAHTHPIIRRAPTHPTRYRRSRTVATLAPAVAGWFGTLLVVQRAWTSSAGRCAPRTGVVAPPCAVGAPLSDMRSGRSRLRTGRYCSRSSGCSGVSVFSISILSSSLPRQSDFVFPHFLQRRGCPVWA